MRIEIQQLIPERVHSIFHSGPMPNEMSIRSHVQYTLIEISLWNETRNESDVHNGQNKDCLQNGKFHSLIQTYKC